MHFSHPRGQWLDPATGAILETFSFLEKMAAKRVVLLGERHDVAEIHRWQLHVAACLHANRRKIIMGFEMFSRGQQAILDNWVNGAYGGGEEFLEQVNWSESWGYPAELYLPLFHFCRQQKLRMLGINCSRELVRRIGKEGWAGVPETEREGLSPSAPPLPGYAEYLAGMMPHHMVRGQNERFVRAQQVWDRAFACNIKTAIEEANENVLLVGIIGKGHMEYGFGTPYQLRDLGIHDVAILLPTFASGHNSEDIKGIGDGIFRLDRV